MLRILFDIFFFAQGLIPLIMVHLLANGELGMAVLYADGVRVPFTFWSLIGLTRLTSHIQEVQDVL